MTVQKQPKKDGNTDPYRKKKSKQHVRLTQRAWIVLIIAVSIITLACVYLFRPQPSIAEKLSLTYLDSLTLADLQQPPEAQFENKAKVEDMTIYGTSLVFYDQPYSPLDTDGYFGRNARLRNIKTGEEIDCTFSGGADSGIDLQNIPAGVYEIYLTNGYTYSRAYMDTQFSSDPWISMRNNRKVRSIRVDADADYLEKFGINSDENYMYLTVTETLPIVRITDVVIDPSGYLEDQNGLQLEWFSQDGFDESEQSYAFGEKIAKWLEDAGLRVTFSREKDEYKSYAGQDSRAGIGYEAQSKIFLSLALSDGNEPRPLFISSPLVNGTLGNTISSELTEHGIELYTPTTVSQLNEGNSYDQFSVDENYELEPYSLQPSIRETGGKATQAGKNKSWQANSAYSDSYGMNSLLFLYASAGDAGSREYFLEHEDEMAKAIAQGILTCCDYQTDLYSQSGSTADLLAEKQSSTESLAVSPLCLLPEAEYNK